MVKVCAIESCPSGRESKMIGKLHPLSFFQPSSQSKLENWAKSLGINLKMSHYICHLHFKAEHIKVYDKIKVGDVIHYSYFEKKVLKEEAVPTIEHQFQPEPVGQQHQICTIQQHQTCITVDRQKPYRSHSKQEQLHTYDGQQQMCVVCNSGDTQEQTLENFQNKVRAHTAAEEQRNSDNEDQEMPVQPIDYFIENIESFSMLPAFWFFLKGHKALEFMRIDPTSKQIKNHICLKEDLSVTMISSNKEEIDLDENIFSLDNIYNYLKYVEKWPSCVGTQIKRKLFSKECKGIIAGNETYQRAQMNPRCKSCRVLRNQLQTRNFTRTGAPVRQYKCVKQLMVNCDLKSETAGFFFSFLKKVKPIKVRNFCFVPLPSKFSNLYRPTNSYETVYSMCNEFQTPMMNKIIKSSDGKFYYRLRQVSESHAKMLEKKGMHKRNVNSKLVILQANSKESGLSLEALSQTNLNSSLEVSEDQNTLEENQNLWSTQAPVMRKIKYKCKKCSFKTYCKALMRQHSKKIHWLKCMFCSHMTRTYIHLRRHMRSHPNNKEKKTFFCTICYAGFFEESYLKYHMRYKHTQKENSVKRFLIVTCNSCNFKHHLKMKVVEHEYIHHGGPKPFSCPQCKYICLRETCLEKHLLKHSEVTTFFCYDCNYKTHRKNMLKAHMVSHRPEKTFLCEVCGILFNSRVHLKSHSVMHSKEAKYLCDICSYKANYKVTFYQHMRSHTGDKPFVCNICEFKTSYKRSLHNHVMAVHIREKLFMCEICGKRFSKKKVLNAHLKTHMENRDKVFVCELCPNMFATRNYLYNHMLSHTEQKLMKCHICDFSTKYKCNLKMHIISHFPRNRTYACVVCDYKTFMKRYLKRHVRRHMQIVSQP